MGRRGAAPVTTALVLGAFSRFPHFGGFIHLHMWVGGRVMGLGGGCGAKGGVMGLLMGQDSWLWGLWGWK